MSIPGQRHRKKKRKNPPVTEIASNCPTCGKAGQVKHIRSDGTVTMICIDCSTEWQSLTEECPVCGKPNGYIVSGTCENCYKKKVGGGVNGKKRNCN